MSKSHADNMEEVHAWKSPDLPMALMLHVRFPIRFAGSQNSPRGTIDEGTGNSLVTDLEALQTDRAGLQVDCVHSKPLENTSPGLDRQVLFLESAIFVPYRDSQGVLLSRLVVVHVFPTWEFALGVVADSLSTTKLSGMEQLRTQQLSWNGWRKAGLEVQRCA